MGKYTEKELTRFIISDLISDIRFTRRLISAGIPGALDNKDYLENSLIPDLRRALKTRNNPKLNTYGWLR